MKLFERGDFPRTNKELVSDVVAGFIALLAAIEALLAARVADDLANVPQDKEFKPNQELIGQGLATIASSFVGGIPSTGAIART